MAILYLYNFFSVKFFKNFVFVSDEKQIANSISHSKLHRKGLEIKLQDGSINLYDFKSVNNGDSAYKVKCVLC